MPLPFANCLTVKCQAWLVFSKAILWLAPGAANLLHAHFKYGKRFGACSCFVFDLVEERGG